MNIDYSAIVKKYLLIGTRIPQDPNLSIAFAIILLHYLLYILIEPYQQPIRDTNDLSYPYINSTVPTWLLLVISILIPYLIMAGYNIITGYYPSLSSYYVSFDWLYMGLVMAQAAAISGMITVTTKIMCGVLRPNFVNMCQYDIATGKCLADISEVYNSRTSFPSGHSSIAFAGLTPFSLWLLNKLHLKEYQRNRSFRVIIGFIPLYAALLIAISRVRDWYHHPADILAGSVIGLASGYFAYFLNYPSLYNENAATPLGEVNKKEEFSSDAEKKTFSETINNV